MQITLREILRPDKKSVVALGNFDGVHLGHQKLIKTAVSHAVQNGFLSCVYTFGEHPSNFKGGMNALINDNIERVEMTEALGVDVLCFDDFEKIKGLSCRSFCEDILVNCLDCEVAVCGKNYRFGCKRSGDTATLVSEMERLGKKVIVIDDVALSDGLVSSTVIRQLITAGEVEKAAEYLGRNFCLNSVVIHGKQLGRKLDAPTVNQLFPDEKIKPKNGVYICICHVEGKKYPGVTNVGVAPTVAEGDEPAVVCETHIIGFSGDLYGKMVKLEFCKRLRDEKKFPSVDELKKEIAHNVKQAKEYFEEREGML